MVCHVVVKTINFAFASQRQNIPVGASALPIGKFLQVSTKLARNQVKTYHKSEKFLDSLECFRTVWKYVGQSGKFWTIWKEVYHNMDKITELSHQQSLPKKNGWYDLCNFGIYVVEIIYALRPESLCPQNSADRKVETIWASLPLSGRPKKAQNLSSARSSRNQHDPNTPKENLDL